MRYWYDFILHFLSANSRHGTHSPFVYRMADDVIYKSSASVDDTKFNKSDRLILELQSYLKKEIGQEVKVFDIREVSLEEILVLYQKLSCLILTNIYETQESKKKWSLLRNHLNTKITIDLFYFGILIHRREQRKENFKLRFPFNKY